MKWLKTKFYRFVNNSFEISLEFKFFNILILMGILYSLYAAIINFTLGYSLLSVFLPLFIGITLIIVCKISYKTNKYLLFTRILLNILTFIVYPIMWFQVGGSFGSTPYFLILHAVIIIVLRKKYIFSLILVILTLIFLEHNFPYLISEHNSTIPRYLSTGVSLIIICFSISLMISVIMTEYKKCIELLKKSQEELELSNKKLTKTSITDELSGLFNRRFIMNKLNKEASLGNLSVIMLDIDNFKKINDTYGHSFGDVVIQEVSNTIKNNIRKTDYAGRIGGEEFLILLPDATNNMYSKAENIRSIISNLKWKYPDVKVTISCGIYTMLENDKIEDIMINVDKYLYKAKHSGKNIVIGINDI